MRDMEYDRRAKAVPDMLRTLNLECIRVIALLDHATTTRRLVASTPRLTGVGLAWAGEPGGEDQVILGHAVNTTTDLVEGLVVPIGAGLGGRVLAARRPLWVSDYGASPEISPHFKPHVTVEGIKAMIAVPIIHDGRLLGVLYGANRETTPFGDRATEAMEQVAAGIAAGQVAAERARHAVEVAVHEERRRLALEMHDTVGAMLFTLGASIRRLGDEPALDADVRTRLAAIALQAVEATAALRGSLRVLSAPPEPVALGVALREHCRAFQDRTGISTRVINLCELPPLAGYGVRALADATREALLNVEKHARARSVVVSVFEARGGVAVAVSDDGVGLRRSGNGDDPGPGLGLSAAAERLGRLGGTLTVAPGDDGGVTVQAWLSS